MLLVEYILIIEIDLLYGWAVLERRPNHVNKRVVADIWFWQFLQPWHGRWYEYEIFIASCTDNIYDLENERWLLGDMIDHVGIYGSRVAEGLSASNVGLVKSNSLSENTCTLHYNFIEVTQHNMMISLFPWFVTDWNVDCIIKSMLAVVLIMAWCCQATRHYLDQCWANPMAPLGYNELRWWNLDA